MAAKRDAALTYVRPDQIPPRLMCAVCLEPFTDPRRLPCKHLFCAACATDVLGRAAQASCPTCRAPFAAGQLVQADETLLELLGELDVYCPNKALNCAWHGPRANVVEHVARTCDFVCCKFKRNGCTMINRGAVVRVHEAECEFAEVPCRLACGFVGQRRLQVEHEAGPCPVAIKHREKAAKKAADEERARRCDPFSLFTCLTHHSAQIEAQEKEERELAATFDLLNPPAAEIVRLRAGGRVFEVSHAAIRRTPSLLASLLAGRRQLNKDESGAIVLAVDATSLEHVIAWLNTDFLPVGLTENAYGLLIATAKTLRLAAFVQSLTERRAAGSPMTQAELIGYLQIHAMSKNSGPVDLSGFNLSGLQLSGDLTGWNFSGTKLNNCTFRGAKLWEAKFHGACLRGADFTNSNITGAQFIGADLTAARLEDVSTQVVVDAYSPLQSRAVVPPSFEQADMTDAIVIPHPLAGRLKTALLRARVPPHM